MFRTIKNLFILLLIGITASGMPIYASSLDFSTLIPTITTDRNIITVTTEEKVISTNHVQIKYNFFSQSDYTNFSFNKDKPFSIELISNGNKIENISTNDLILEDQFVSLELYANAPATLTFDFDQKKLNLPDGIYDLEIIPHIEDQKIETDNTKFKIKYNTKGDYTYAQAHTKTSVTPLTLYFPDDEMNYLVPITRFVPSTSSPLTTTLRNLEKGPSNAFGLLEGSPIPIGGKAGKDGNTAHVNLPKNLAPYDKGSSVSFASVYSLVHSLTSINGISKVQFHFDGKILKDAFHGMIMDEPYMKSSENQIYTSYISNADRFLLLPVPFNKFGAEYGKANIETIFNAMKFQVAPEIYNSKVHPIVPEEVELLSYKTNNGMLSLTFNEAFTKAFEEEPMKRQMMVDGIIFTFMSMRNINSVDIQVKIGTTDSKNEQIINYDFDIPIYINPEI